MSKNIVEVSVNISGKFNSYNGLGVGTKLQLAYRDIATGKFEIIEETEVDEDMSYGFFKEGVKITGEGKELVVIYNKKYLVVDFFKKDILGKLATKQVHILDSNVENDGSYYVANFVENSEKEAKDILRDKMVEAYILEQRFSGEMSNEIIDDGNWENEDLNSETLHQRFTELTWSRKDKVNKMIESGSSRKEIFNFVFDDFGLRENLKAEGFSDNAIAYIRDNGYNASLSLMQQVTLPQQYKEIKEYVDEVNSMSTEEFISGGKKEIKPSEDSGQNSKPIETTKNDIIINIGKEEEVFKEPTIAGQNIFDVVLVATVVTVIVSGVLFFIWKKKHGKKENGE